jgi:class 3 adenylate cyclase
LVSQAVVDAASSVSASFTDIGLFEVKGVGEEVRLFRAGHAG